MNPQLVWTQSECDTRPPDKYAPTCVILRQGNDLTYAVQEPHTTDWHVFRLNIELGTQRASQKPYRCFIEAKRAHDAGAIIWGESR